MTQEQALEQAKSIFPEWAHEIKIERTRCIGVRFGTLNEFRLWRIRDRSSCEIVATSERNYEHMLAIAKSNNEDIWPEDCSPVEGEAVSA